MSVDTRTPRTPTGESPPGSYDSQSVLSAVKVPSDPAQVIVNNVSFRVRLGAPPSQSRHVAAATVPSKAGVAPGHTPHASGRRLVSAAGTPVPLLNPASHSLGVAAGGLLGGVPRVPGGSAPSAAGDRPAARRRPPVVWSGRTMPGDAEAGQLLRAVRQSTAPPVPPVLDEEPLAATTQTLPRPQPDWEDPPTVVRPRLPESAAPLLGSAPPARGAYDVDPDPSQPYPAYDPYGSAPYDPDDPYGPDAPYGDRPTGDGFEDADGEDDRRRAAPLPAESGESGRREGRSTREATRHAYYPDRRMNLGIVLLPLRFFLGFISLYAGMGKLTDPVYFDGGERGSMVTWLRGLEPWSIASPLHDFAVSHPVGAGLTVAFLQVVVGVLTIFGLWQRAVAGVGALLSVVLLMTISWNTVAAYDAPDIIYLAAWSPLIIAGAPVYSLDARLAGEAWRTLGPRSRLVDLRRRVLRRGTLLVTLLVGLALLIGSILGSAVRSSQVATVPEPGEAPRNNLPGSPAPKEPRSATPSATEGPGSEPTAGQSAGPDQRESAPPSQEPGADSGAGSGPSQDQTVQAPPPEQEQNQPAPPQQPEAPAPTTGGGEAPGDGGAGGGDGGGEAQRESDDGGSGRGALGGLLGR
ncbi:DoxX family membrane protein [Streptomyces sp. XM4193]|uniref:DoxX family membrane protein n=1 Tax=Streptomyces sp. XM4193 TaxID=2929782 RepID=UPI001FF908E5|nr:DoxX family membrane protein [Streptomyces sp. XM4193]MCK1795220.1 DoxX family membrane protein [Streptomyces sp. XM4193]